jgi:hypothetical protein
MIDNFGEGGIAMGGVVSSLFGGPKIPKPKGPSEAELMAQKEQRDAALKDRAEQERLRALASNARGRRATLTYVDPGGANQTLGG